MSDLLLVFDTETDRLINTYQPPSHPSQPNLVQLAALLIEPDGTERAAVSLIVAPAPGAEIPAAATAVHGISTEIARRAGVPAIVAAGMLSNLIKLSGTHIAHNADFDTAVIATLFHRVGRPMPLLNPRCTKNLAEPVLNLPPTARMIAAGFNKPKAPTLTECVRFLFDEELAGAHDALVDARACARVYLELTRRGVATRGD